VIPAILRGNPRFKALDARQRTSGMTNKVVR
jgi:hypothetical protein